MFLRLTQFGCNLGCQDLTVHTTQTITNLGQKNKPWAKPQTPHWLVQRQLVGSGLPGDWCPWQTPLPGLSPGIYFDYEQKDCLDESEKEKRALSNWHMSLGCVGKRKRHQSGETRVRSKGGVQSE